MRLAAVVTLVVACSSEPPAAAPPAGPAIAAIDEPAWRAALTAERDAKDRELATDVTSPYAGIERFAPTAAAQLTVVDDSVRLDAAPGPSAVVAFEPDTATPPRWSWRALAPGVRTTSLDGARTLTEGALAEPALLQLTPRFAAKAQVVADELVVTVFDSQRPELRAFRALRYFAPDARFAVRASLERSAAPRTVELETSRGLRKAFVEVGTLRFELDGARHGLVAYRPVGSAGRDLFVPFRDATTGKATYPVARFLDLEEPEAAGAPVVIDFNRAYNPLCAYSPAYNCPIPPAANTLAVAVEAGELMPH